MIPWPADIPDLTPTERNRNLLKRVYSNCLTEDRGYETPCYEWQGATTGTGRGGGYGRIRVDNVLSLPHRVVWACFNGYLPPKRQIDHLCNNRLCCRVEHLESVTGSQNAKRRDAVMEKLEREYRT